VDPGAARHPQLAQPDWPAPLGPLRSAGDLGYVDEDGYLYLRGRRDRTINSGGLKVSPETVEMTLLKHPMVRDALVRGVPDEDLGRRVEALVSLEDHADFEAHATVLRDFCLRLLPSSHVPARITIVDEIDRTEAGKLLIPTRENPMAARQ
jgi:acyl-CoA synthetase (AMP-forming)/AMP-acid ligase II